MIDNRPLDSRPQSVRPKASSQRGGKPAATREPKTALSSDEIYDRVRRMAARFEFRPNERINEIELSHKLDVSRTPLREVLNQLMVEGFLTRTQNKGFIGRPLDAGQVLGLYEFRRGIECAAAALACERATDEEIAALDEFTRASNQVSEDESSTRLCELDEEFHMRIVRMAKNPEYERALENINARIHYIRWIRMRRGSRQHTQGEHAKIVQAIQARDPQQVIALLEQHISRRLDQIVEAVKAGFAEIYTREFDASGAGASPPG